jgi:hypothetical protein
MIKLQGSFKLQGSNSNARWLEAWGLEFLWILDFGFWNFVRPNPTEEPAA